MYIFIVTWVLITVIPPEQWQAHEPNDYGMYGYQTSTSGMHGTDHERTITEEFTKVFLVKEDAQKFIVYGKVIAEEHGEAHRYELKNLKLQGRYAQLPHKWDETGLRISEQYYLRLEDAQVIKVSALQDRNAVGMFFIGLVIGGIIYHAANGSY